MLPLMVSKVVRIILCKLLFQVNSCTAKTAYFQLMSRASLGEFIEGGCRRPFTSTNQISCCFRARETLPACLPARTGSGTASQGSAFDSSFLTLSCQGFKAFFLAFHQNKYKVVTLSAPNSLWAWSIS